MPFQALVAELHTRLEAAGYGDIRPVHSAVFAHLGPEGLRLTELADRAQLTKQLMHYVVGALETLGYVERVPDPGDRRAKLICLTERGLVASLTGASIIDQIEAEWAGQLGDAHMEDLRRLLMSLGAMLNEVRPA